MPKCCSECIDGIFNKVIDPDRKVLINGKPCEVTKLIDGYCKSVGFRPPRKSVEPGDGADCKMFSSRQRNQNCRVQIVHPDGSTTTLRWDDRTVPLVDAFWDCSCEEDYFRPASQKKCKKCKAEEQDMPSSRLSELVEWLIKKIESQPGELEFPVERTPATIESED